MADGSGPEITHAATLQEARGWVGAKLDDIGGDAAGRIEAVLVRAGEPERPSWLAVKLNGLRGRRTAVPFDAVAAGVQRIWSPFDRETLRSAPSFDARGGLRAGDERDLLEHFGYPPGSGAVAALAELDENETASVPAPGPEG